MCERWKLRTLRFLGIRESVYSFKHLDKFIETIIPNARVASWFSKKDPKKTVQPAVSGDAHFVFRQCNTLPNLSEMAGPGPSRTIDISHPGRNPDIWKRYYFSASQPRYIFRMVGTGRQHSCSATQAAYHRDIPTPNLKPPNSRGGPHIKPT
jgi:hypothetical protein